MIYAIYHEIDGDDVYFIKAESDSNAIRKAVDVLRDWNDDDGNHHLDHWYGMYHARAVNINEELWEEATKPLYKTEIPHIMITGDYLLTMCAISFPHYWSLFVETSDMVEEAKNYRKDDLIRVVNL